MNVPTHKGLLHFNIFQAFFSTFFQDMKFYLIIFVR